MMQHKDKDFVFLETAFERATRTDDFMSVTERKMQG